MVHGAVVPVAEYGRAKDEKQGEDVPAEEKTIAHDQTLLGACVLVHYVARDVRSEEKPGNVEKELTEGK